MYGISPFILIVLPLIFQIIYGRKAIGETIKLSFREVCLISLLSQIICFFLANEIASYNFNIWLNGAQYRCGMGLLGIIALEFFFTIFLLIAILIQFFIWRSYNRDK